MKNEYMHSYFHGPRRGVHGYMPESFMASLMGKSAWRFVPLVMLIGRIKDVDGPCGLSYSSFMSKGMLPSIVDISIFYFLFEDADADPTGRG